MNDDPPPQPQQNEPIQQSQKVVHPSLYISIRPPILINLDNDDEIAKIDEKVHNDLNTLFSYSMSLNEKSPKMSVEPSASLIPALSLVPLASFPPSAYHEHDWEVDELLDS